VSRLVLEGISKSYGEHWVVRDVSLPIEEGELVVLLGPSGCGKTTTLRMIGGFVEPTAGRVRLGARDITVLPPYRRNTGLVFQGYALFPHLTAAQNVAFGLEMRRLAMGVIRDKVEEALRLVRLEGLGDRLPRELSGGQQQRVALARALVNQPAVLLLDEPLGALDLQLRKQMQVELKQIQREVGITFIYVTHDQEEALTMSDRIAVMNDGVVQQCGKPEDVYERPEKPFVAGFIGISNLLDGQVQDGGVRLATGTLVPVSLPDGCGQGEEVHLSVRPEKIWLADFEDDMVVLDGTLVETVYLGTTTQYIVELAPGARVVALEQNLARARNEERWQQGEPVRIGWKREHCLVLR
jgi:spermidine/putrescine transport system ATP-binding protein